MGDGGIENKMGKEKILVLVGMLILAVSLVSFASASEWVCLGYGESLPLDTRGIDCWKTLCLHCVSDTGFSTNFDKCSSSPPCGGSGSTELDVTPPELIVNSPVEGGLYRSRKVLFDVDSNEPFSLYYLDNINGRGRWKRIGSNLDDYSRSVSFKDGFNNVTILGRDRNNNPVEFVRTFVVDSKKPKISRVEPRRGATNGLLSLDFKESNPDEIILEFAGTESVVYDSAWIDANCGVNVKDARKRHCEFDVRAEFGVFDGEEISYSFSVEDVVGNVYVKTVKKIVVDTSEPVLNNPGSFWLQGQGRYAKYIYFSLNISEENLDEATYSYIDSRGKTKVKKICSRLKDGLCEKKKSFRNGDEILGVQITDDAGNSVGYPVDLIVSY